MKTFMYCGSVLVALVGLVIFSAAQGAIHEIEAWVCFLISAVLLVGGSIRSSLQNISGRIDGVVLAPPLSAPPETVEAPVPAPVAPVVDPVSRPLGWVEQARAEMQKDRAKQEGV